LFGKSPPCRLLASAVWMPPGHVYTVYLADAIHLLDPSTCCVENALNLREFLEGKDCELVVTDDKEGDDSGRPRL
jgi:hypothetical protein